MPTSLAYAPIAGNACPGAAAHRNYSDGGLMAIIGRYVDKQVESYEGEEVVYSAHKSYVPALMSFMRFMMLFSVIGGAVWGFSRLMGRGLFVVGVGAALSAVAQLPKIFRNLAFTCKVTNQRIICNTGIVTARDNRSTRLDSLVNVDVDQASWAAMLFDYGDVSVMTKGNESTYYAFKKVANPRRLRDVIFDEQSRYPETKARIERERAEAARRREERRRKAEERREEEARRAEEERRRAETRDVRPPYPTPSPDAAQPGNRRAAWRNDRGRR